MKHKFSIFNFQFSILLIFIFSFFVFSFSSAQEGPQIFVTWSANSYVPPDFTGKQLPSPGSLVRVRLMVLDGGFTADLTNREVRWFIDGEPYRNGAGLQTVEFRAPNLAGQILKVRAQVPDFKGGSLSKTIDVPVVRPEAVISAPTSGNEFSEPNLKITARPFFFNTADVNALLFGWQVNRQNPVPSGEPDILSLAISGARNGFRVQINLSVENEGASESASTAKSLIYRR